MILRKLKSCTDEEGIILKPEGLMLDPKGAPHYIENFGNEEAGSSRF